MITNSSAKGPRRAAGLTEGEHQAGHPHGHHQRVEVEQLARHEQRATLLGEHLVPQRADERERGEVVLHLPTRGSVRRLRAPPGHRPTATAAPAHDARAWPAHPAASAPAHSSELCLARMGQPQHGAGPQPRPRARAAQRPRHQQRHQRAQKDLDDRDVEHAAEPQRRGRYGGAHQRERHRACAAAPLAHQQGRAEQGAHARHDGRQSQQQQAATQLVGRACQPRDQRRVVHVPQRQASSALDEVELVPVVAVALHQRQVQQRLQRAQQSDHAPPRVAQGSRHDARHARISTASACTSSPPRWPPPPQHHRRAGRHPTACARPTAPRSRGSCARQGARSGPRACGPRRCCARSRR
jgi:hypothetical protein